MSYTVKTFYDNGYVVEEVSQGKLPCRSWILLPAENLWSDALKGILYIVALFYFFVGIAIASDIFMSSIEVITSKKRKVVKWDSSRGEKVEMEVLIWNETVANLTLMALGSSAPEILLAVIETVSNLGDNENVKDSLGTFTIIGSAAFNLLIITGLCIYSVPSPQVKSVLEFGVFMVTAVWSILAYVWMLMVVKYISPGEIEPWEAWCTLAFMPMFVFIAYCTDNGLWCRKKKVEDGEEEVGTKL